MRDGQLAAANGLRRFLASHNNHANHRWIERLSQIARFVVKDQPTIKASILSKKDNFYPYESGDNRFKDKKE